MTKTFKIAEQHILDLFKKGTNFSYRNKDYTVILSGKPQSKKGGKPKTDIYIYAETFEHINKEFKISFKKKNANFLENKISANRAQQLFGDNWENIISNATSKLKPKFFSRKLIYKEKFGKTNKGAITLGWKFELLNVKSGELSGNMYLNREQIIDVYAGTNLTEEKKNAIVDNKEIYNSGIANFILFEDAPIATAQDAINSLIPIHDYVDQHPDIYFACKALNYRTFVNKYDGNRPLAVYVKWFVENQKLDYKLCFNSPLTPANGVYQDLKNALNLLKVKNTADLNEFNVKDITKIYE